MPISITFDASAEIEGRWPEAMDAGLRAAAYVYYDEVKRALAGGYTTGDFVTGRVLNSVTIGDPHDGMIEVGSDLDYAMYWEVGHHNIFTRKFEQVEIWRPAADVMGQEMADVFGGTALSYLVQGAP